MRSLLHCYVEIALWQIVTKRKHVHVCIPSNETIAHAADQLSFICEPLVVNPRMSSPFDIPYRVHFFFVCLLQKHTNGFLFMHSLCPFQRSFLDCPLEDEGALVEAWMLIMSLRALLIWAPNRCESWKTEIQCRGVETWYAGESQNCSETMKKREEKKKKGEMTGCGESEASWELQLLVNTERQKVYRLRTRLRFIAKSWLTCHTWWPP